jgi:hypothetical protein
MYTAKIGGSSSKWRITLPLTAGLLTIVLALLAAREYQTIRLTPDVFSEGNYLYMPPAQAISYCLNAPSFVASTALSYYFRYNEFFSYLHWFPNSIGPLYYATVVFFWWCIGWELDCRFNLAHAHRLVLLAYGLAVAFSVALTWEGLAQAM